jgi:tetratricopeptide (TPR) repeat protein
MKKCLSVILVLLIAGILCPSGLMAEDVMTQAEEVVEQVQEAIPQVEEAAPQAAPVDVFTQADALLEAESVENCKKALDMCLGVIDKHANDYRANWITAKAFREYANEVKKTERAGWEEICKVNGKKGMAYAEKAMALEPDRPEGYYWYGMNVGSYSDGVSILTALREGLKNKTQDSFETAYKLDKTYDKSGPVIALGRFWQVLPWPLRDRDKSLEYYREYQKMGFYNDPETVEGRIYLAELLIDMGGRKNKAEAKQLLNEALDISQDRYWRKQAKAHLANL